jgi:uncharacterized protein YejL (UPF0352 family)
MFVFNRSALAVLLPLGLLVAGVICTNLATAPRKVVAESPPPVQVESQTVAANLPSR